MTRILLDTHAFIWWLEGGDKLSPVARRAIANPEVTVLVSAATAWEIAIKQHIGKFQAPSLAKNFKSRVEREGFVELPISIEHAVTAGGLPGPHKDPFDRLLMAQSLVENAAVVTRDDQFRRYDVPCVW